MEEEKKKNVFTMLKFAGHEDSFRLHTSSYVKIRRPKNPNAAAECQILLRSDDPLYDRSAFIVCKQKTRPKPSLVRLSDRHLGGDHPSGRVYGSGRLNALTMNAAIAWRLTAVSGQKISGPVPQPVVIPRR